MNRVVIRLSITLDCWKNSCHGATVVAARPTASAMDSQIVTLVASMCGNSVSALFAIVLLDASIIGAAAVTLATSYAFGDMFGIKHSLHRSFRDAKAFYATYTALVVAAAAIVLIPHAPLGLITEAVQALAGLLLPSASVFLLLLCNDPEVLGPWVNPGWLNAAGITLRLGKSSRRRDRTYRGITAGYAAAGLA